MTIRTHGTRARRAVVSAALAGLVLLLSGCQVRVATDVVVDADGSGQVTMRILVDDELREALTEADIDLEEGLEEAATGASWRARSVSDDEGTGVELTTSFSDPAELSARVEALTSGLGVDDGALLRDVVLERTEDEGYAFRASAGIDPPAIVGSVPTDPDAEVRFDGDDLAELLASSDGELARADLRVTFPTVPVAPDGTVETTSVVWELPVDGLREVSASAPPVPVAMRTVLTIAAAVAGLMVGAFAVRARRR